jgi:hypothetical protein
VSAICGGSFPLRRVVHCWNCKRRRRVAGLDLGAWYGVRWTCCGCGDGWADGERLERPFKRGWRVEAIAAARKTWAEAGQYSKADHEAWVMAQIDGAA